MAKKSSLLKPMPAYKCTQDELYAVCLLIWASCKKHIAMFVLFRIYYTLTYIADKITEILTANNIPDAQTRINVAEEKHIGLTKKIDECVEKWRGLELYIIKAFPKDVVKIKLEDAGKSLFKKAAHYNWEKAGQLMKKGSTFIADNLAALQAAGMPATFQAEFDTLKVDGVTMYMEFEQAMDDAEELTTEKVNKNNFIYEELKMVCRDGQHIFRKDRAKKEEFIFSCVLERVRGATSAYHEIKIPANSQKVIEEIVANSPFLNIGQTELVLCNGDVTCTVGTGEVLQSGDATIVQPGVKTITVLNTNATLEGRCKVRVVKH